MQNKKHPRPRKVEVSPRPGSKRSFLASPGIVLLVVLIAALAALGFALSRRAENPTTAKAPAGVGAQPMPSPQYAANKPAKEYIYAGGKLLAVTEPANSLVDVAIWRPASGTWWVVDANSNVSSVPFGLSTDVPTPADYDGDGRTDFAVFRSSDTSWYILLSGSNDTLVVYNFGAAGDVPYPGDYTGDGKADLTLFRPSDSTWHTFDTVQGYIGSAAFGTTGDTPVPGDYDGDGKWDIAVWRGSTGTWYALQSSDGAWGALTWGASGDKPMPGDYDGDLKIDHAVWQSNNNWYIRKSSTGTATNTTWGYQASDKPVQADYDSDGKTDIGVWRPSDGTWYIIRSSNGSQLVHPFGQNGDIPVVGPYRRY